MRKKRALILSGGGSRGAFQVGVWSYLQSKRWFPDLIVGSSVGAMNAVSIGSGVLPAQLVQIWKQCERKDIYTVAIKKKFLMLHKPKKAEPYMNTEPLRRLIEHYLDLEKLKNSPIDILISAVNMQTSNLHYFDKNEITTEHLMAATAIPQLFPWVVINGQPYWDGGILANTPIYPALEQKYDEIIVVLLSPVGAFALAEPTSGLEVQHLVFEQLLTASYQTCMAHLKMITTIGNNEHSGKGDTPQYTPAIWTVAPKKMLGFRSLLNFNRNQTNQLIEEGRLCAEEQLEELF